MRHRLGLNHNVVIAMPAMVPIQFENAVPGNIFGHAGRVSKRRYEYGMMRLFQRGQRIGIEMVIMIMAYQHDVDGWQIIESDARRMNALWPGKAQGAGAV